MQAIDLQLDVEEDQSIIPISMNVPKNKNMKKNEDTNIKIVRIAIKALVSNDNRKINILDEVVLFAFQDRVFHNLQDD